MTQYEMLDLVASYQGAAYAAIMAYFSIFSGYCAVAYLVGKDLKRSQVMMITGLFIIMSLFMTWGAFTFFFASRLLVEQAIALPNGDSVARARSPIAPYLIITPLLFLGILAGLKFMWDIRYSKKQ